MLPLLPDLSLGTFKPIEFGRELSQIGWNIRLVGSTTYTVQPNDLRMRADYAPGGLYHESNAPAHSPRASARSNNFISPWTIKFYGFIHTSPDAIQELDT